GGYSLDRTPCAFGYPPGARRRVNRRLATVVRAAVSIVCPRSPPGKRGEHLDSAWRPRMIALSCACEPPCDPRPASGEARVPGGGNRPKSVRRRLRIHRPAGADGSSGFFLLAG